MAIKTMSKSKVFSVSRKNFTFYFVQAIMETEKRCPHDWKNRILKPIDYMA